MKITAIKAQNLTVHRLTQVEIESPVALFLGPQEAGKSTLAEVVSIALGGRSIRLPMLKDIPALVADPNMAGEARVRVDDGNGRDVWYGGLLNVGKVPGLKTPTLKLPPRSLAALFEWRKVMEMGPETRREILSGLMGLYDGPRMRELIMANAKVLPESVGEVLPDVNKATTTAIEMRRSFKRRLAEMDRAPAALESKVEIKGRAFNLEELEREKILASLEGLKAKLREENGDYSNHTEAMGIINSARRRLEKGEAELDALDVPTTEELSGLMATNITLGGSRAQLKAELEGMKALVGREDCPFFNVGCKHVQATNPESVKKFIDALEEKIADVESGQFDVGEEIQRKKIAKDTASNVQRGITQLKIEIEEAEKRLVERFENTLPEAFERAVVGPLRNRIATGEELLRKFDAYHEAKKMVGAVSDQDRAAFEKRIEEIDACVKYLEEGLRRDLMADSLWALRERVAKTASILPGHDVELTDDLDIMVDGRPVDVLSESQRFRVFFIIQEAIANLSGLKILLVDRLEILRGEFQRAFINMILKIAKDYDSILLFATADERPEGAPPGFSIYWVDRGEVEKVE